MRKLLRPQDLEHEPNDPRAIKLLQRTLFLLVLELTFEGIARKLNISGTSLAIFLLKDVIVAVLGIQVLRLRRSAAIGFLWKAYLVEIFLFMPLIFQTAVHDPVLAVFGAKEYLFYPLVAFAVFLAFENASVQEIIRFFRGMALLIIPTVAVALLQLRLPASHWLNLSVGGDNLDAFSAAGFLRVSSTFSFVAQYCAFINAEVFITMIALNSLKDVGWFWKMIYLSLVPLLIVSSYITGSRGAVLINCLIIAIAVGLSLMKFQLRTAIRVVFIIGGLLLTLAVAQYVFPDAFAAYSEREQGQLIGASAEMQARVYDTMFGWTNSISTTPFLGYGLGIMSNGSEMLSRYAGMTRAFSWTETDFATTLFEGGFYLILVWYAFRYYIIYQVVRRFLAMRGQELSVPGAFSVGFVIVMGITGTLGIQPPIAIWWWISVGIALVIWWKSVEPAPAAPPSDKSAPPPAPPSVPGKRRGQSAYAERLHLGRK
jgi:hypothetical protein